MKDMIGREIKEGCYIAYGLVVGRSANLAIYHVRELVGDKIKAHKLDESYGNYKITLEDGSQVYSKYATFEYDKNSGKGYWRAMTHSEREKVDAKTVTLSMGKRALVIDEHTVNHLKDI